MLLLKGCTLNSNICNFTRAYITWNFLTVWRNEMQDIQAFEFGTQHENFPKKEKLGMAEVGENFLTLFFFSEAKKNMVSGDKEAPQIKAFWEVIHLALVPCREMLVNGCWPRVMG